MHNEIIILQACNLHTNCLCVCVFVCVWFTFSMPRLRLRLRLSLTLLMLMLGTLVQAQGNFEDADKANDYTDQQFDLRHTIPGEPGVDYPILSEVPKTSFVCQGRHEGRVE